MSTETELIGKWTLLAWEQVYDDGRIEYPMGEKLEGFIRYSADGGMMCMLSRADRPAFVSGGQWSASAEEKAAAYDSMLCYAGRYQRDGDLISHHVEMSLFPNWKGGTQKRRVEKLAGSELVLIARLEEGSAEARTSRLIWRRVENRGDQ